MLTVKQLLRSKGEQHSTLYYLTPDHTVMDALKLMAKQNIGAVLVVEKGMLVGIFSERDYARRGNVTGEICEKRQLRDLMTKRVFFIDPDKTMEDCMSLMSHKHIRHLPVMRDGQLLGMITIRDVVNTLVSEQENRIRELESYISGGYGGY